jgi:hypothetical protein
LRDTDNRQPKIAYLPTQQRPNLFSAIAAQKIFGSNHRSLRTTPPTVKKSDRKSTDAMGFVKMDVVQ